MHNATTTEVIITYGDERVVMTWGSDKDNICVDGYRTPYIGADASCRTEAAVRLACHHTWGPVYETTEEAYAAGHRPGDNITIWADVSYAAV